MLNNLEEIEDIKEDVISITKPWGNFRQFILNRNATVKIITVHPGHRLSKQYHNMRDEIWVLLDDGLEVELDSIKSRPKKGEELFIKRGVVHRLSCIGKTPGRVVEISLGSFDEEDITRLEDDYSRVNPE